MEMKTGCNLFVTKENIRQFDQLVADLQHSGMPEITPGSMTFPLMHLDATLNFCDQNTGMLSR
jgi:hypothetical protein